MILLGFCLLNTAIMLLLVFRTVVFCHRLPRPENYSLPDNELPAVSIIVPARNEESCVGACLESLACQNYPNFEVVIIDDGSTDGTGAIIQELAGKYPCIKPLKSSSSPPPGWMGKCHVVVQAIPHASGKWFAFVDADTIHKPDMLRHAISYLIKDQASMVSFWSKNRLGSFGERLMTPAVFNAFQWGDWRLTINDLKSSMAYGIGHCMVINRDAYFAVGGHRAAREWRIDDHALAMLLRNQGFQIRMADGRQMFTVRMYTNFESFFFGWAQQLFLIMRFNVVRVLFHMAYITSMLVLPFVQLALLALLAPTGILQSIYISQYGPGYVLVLTFLVCLQLAIVAFWYGKIRSFHEGAGWGYFLLLPLTGILIVALDLYTAALGLTGFEQNWKGRIVKVTLPKVPPDPVPWQDPQVLGAD